MLIDIELICWGKIGTIYSYWITKEWEWIYNYKSLIYVILLDMMESMIITLDINFNNDPLSYLKRLFNIQFIIWCLNYPRKIIMLPSFLWHYLVSMTLHCIYKLDFLVQNDPYYYNWWLNTLLLWLREVTRLLER